MSCFKSKLSSFKYSYVNEELIIIFYTTLVHYMHCRYSFNNIFSILTIIIYIISNLELYLKNKYEYLKLL